MNVAVFQVMANVSHENYEWCRDVLPHSNSGSTPNKQNVSLILGCALSLGNLKGFEQIGGTTTGSCGVCFKSV